MPFIYDGGMASEPDPPWVREAFGAIAHEVVAWLRALAAVTVAPRRFVAAWSDGELRPLNPLAFSLNTLAVAGPVVAILVRLLGIEDDVLPLWAQLLKPLFPWIYNLVWLVPVHYGLRALGGQRRLSTTVGASFYANGPVHIARLFAAPLQLRQLAHPHNFRLAVEAALGGLAIMILFCIYLTAAMAGAHKLPRWRAAIVVVAVFAVSAVLWAWFGIVTKDAGLRVVRALIT